MDTRQILEAQRNLYIEPGDKILFIVTTDFQNAPISKVFWGYEHQIVEIPDLQRPGEDYPLDESLLEGKTVGWLISNVSISHSAATQKMIKKGMFLISNPGVTPDWSAILNKANVKPCQEHAGAILRAIGGNAGGKFHIVADDGTDLLLKVPKKNWYAEIGLRKGLGTNGLFGELTTAPYQAEGTLVLQPGDFLTNPINEVNEEIILTIHDNHVVEIRGESQSETLKKMLEYPEKPEAFNLGEFAIGLNPGNPGKIYRSVVAEKLSGGIHVAIGTNEICLKKTCPEISKFRYGRYNAGVHVDCIKFGASVFFGPETPTTTILKRGILTV